MIRENPRGPVQKHAFMAVTPGSGLAAQRREVTGGGSGHSGSSGKAPKWVRLVRASDTFTYYTSEDALTWKQRLQINIPMANQVFCRPGS